MDWTSMALGDLDRDTEVDHAIEADLNWDPVWITESSDSSAPSSSSFSTQDGVSHSKDALPLADMDMVSRRGGSSTIHAEGQHTLPGHKTQHPTGMHHSPPPTTTPLYQPPFTGDFLRHTSSPEKPSLETGQTLEPVQPLLHAAVRSCNHTIVAMLLQRGAAAVNDRNGNGTTALHIATELGDEAIVSLLLDYGADSSARDAWGKDALYLAVSAGHTSIVELMLDKRRMASQDSCILSC